MKYDERSGLWVPDQCVDTKTVFPPVLRTFEDAKPPVRMDGLTKDRPMNTNSGWNDEKIWHRKPQS